MNLSIEELKKETCYSYGGCNCVLHGCMFNGCSLANAIKAKAKEEKLSESETEKLLSSIKSN